MDTSIFVIKSVKKRTIEDVLKAGNYDEVNFLIKDGIRKKTLCMQDEKIGDRKIILLGSDDSMSSQEVFSHALRNGLNRPTRGDAFLFGEQHPDEQRKGPIVFLHDPEYSWSAYSFHLLLDANRRHRIISLISSGGWWHSGYRFALVGR